jgi:uncharacterized protein (TIGR01777 family)
MEKQVLITGATGMIGKTLVSALLQNGYKVSILSRRAQPIKNVNVFLWNVEDQTIDTKCFQGVTSIIHLAGENVAAGKWTEKRKQQILDSRVNATRLLYQGLSATNHHVNTIISASAVGYYGDRIDEILTESSQKGEGFLAECCLQWEDAVNEGERLNLRVVKLRTGVVLDKNDGALPVMAKPIQFFLAAPLGTGKQWVPWIHITDLVKMYIDALEKPISGNFNACAPNPVTNKTLTQQLAKALKRPVWPIHVPASVIKTLMGEMSEVILASTNCSAQKILDTGFKFKYNLLQEALLDIYK